MTIHISIVRMCCKRCAMLHGSPKTAKVPCLVQCDQIASYISPETILNRLHAVENIISQQNTRRWRTQSVTESAETIEKRELRFPANPGVRKFLKTKWLVGSEPETRRPRFALV